MQTRLYIASAVILLTGLGGALVVYATAGNAPDPGMVDEFLNSKRYAHELRAYGGNATLLADEFYRWFESLWRGKQLACTIAFFTVLLSFAVLFFAWHVPFQESEGTAGGTDPAEKTVPDDKG